jgi:hypothetical protein
MTESPIVCSSLRQSLAASTAIWVMPGLSRPKTTRRWRIDGPSAAFQALVGPLDQLGAALGEDLDGDVVGDEILLHQLADEVEVRLAGRREADLDLLEAHLHHGLEHPPLADGVHGLDQRLVAVPEVDGAPEGSLLDPPVRPRPVLEDEGQERAVLLERHLLGVRRLRGHGGFLPFTGKQKTPCREGRRLQASADIGAPALHKEESGGREETQHPVDREARSPIRQARPPHRWAGRSPSAWADVSSG